MVGRGVGYVVLFAMPITLSRMFTPAEYGTYKQLFMIFGLLLGMGQIGMAESLYYFLPRSPEKAGRYIANTILLLGLSGLLLIGITYVGAAPLARWWSNPGLVTYLPLVGFATALMLVSISFETVLVSRSEYKAASILYGTTDLARAVIVLGSALLTRDLHWLLIGTVVYAALRCLAMLIYLVRHYRSEFRVDVQLGLEQLKYALPYTIALYAGIAPQGFLLASWVPAAVFAIYSVGCLEVPLFEMAANAFGNVLMVNLGEHLRSGRPVAGLWHQTTERLGLILIPLVAALLITAPELFAVLFPSTYRDSVPIFQVYVLTALFSVLPTDYVLRSYAENRTLLVLKLVQLVTVLSVMHYLVDHFGLVGAVISTLVASVLFKVGAVIRIGRLMQLGVRDLLAWRSLALIFVATGLASIPAALFRSAFLHWPPLALGAMTTLVFSLAYVPIVAAWGLLPRSAIWPRLLRRNSSTSLSPSEP